MLSLSLDHIRTEWIRVFFLVTKLATPSFAVSSDVMLFHIRLQLNCFTLLAVCRLLSLSVRTFTMPSGQSGRTLWNVPKLSNRFQVLRATGQPPTITPLCVSCVIGLPAQQSKHRHFSSTRERTELWNGYPSLFTVKIFACLYNRQFFFTLSLFHCEPYPSPLTRI